MYLTSSSPTADVFTQTNDFSFFIRSEIRSRTLLSNTTCALLIARHRKEEGGLVAAAYFSARNDAMANVLIIGAGLFTLRYPSIWPDLLIGIFIFVMNAVAAKEILETANKEGKAHRA